MDFITDFPLSTKLKVKTLLIITDRLNKGVMLIPIISIFTPAMATAFMERYCNGPWPGLCSWLLARTCLGGLAVQAGTPFSL